MALRIYTERGLQAIAEERGRAAELALQEYQELRRGVSDHLSEDELIRLAREAIHAAANYKEPGQPKPRPEVVSLLKVAADHGLRNAMALVMGMQVAIYDRGHSVDGPRRPPAEAEAELEMVERKLAAANFGPFDEEMYEVWRDQLLVELGRKEPDDDDE